MTKDDHKLVEHQLRELESPSKELTDWEEKFLESVRIQYENYSSLSVKQLAILDKIYADKTA